MKFFPTPPHIVDVIKRHLPKSYCSLLEPAVGDGALLESLGSISSSIDYFLIDIDKSRLNNVKNFDSKAKLIEADFLCWSKENCENNFDLILTNPPFSGKSSEWVYFEDKHIPLEVAFIKACLNQLSSNGTLIAIVPDSIVNSHRWISLRKLMFERGAFRYVYQLPEKTFYKIEGAFYLFIFKNGGISNQVILRRYGEDKNTEIVCPSTEIESNDFRLDYDFYRAQRAYDTVFEFFPNAESWSLSSVVYFNRGKVTCDYNNKMYFHSSALMNHATFITHKKIPDKNLSIVVKRVSRNAHLSFGLMPSSEASLCTDCLFILESKKIDALIILFSLRVLYANQDGARMILKGAGAKFISLKNLKNLKFFDLANVFPNEFSIYSEYFWNKEYTKCSMIEASIYQSLQAKGAVSSFNLKKLSLTHKRVEEAFSKRSKS